MSEGGWQADRQTDRQTDRVIRTPSEVTRDSRAPQMRLGVVVVSQSPRVSSCAAAAAHRRGAQRRDVGRPTTREGCSTVPDRHEGDAAYACACARRCVQVLCVCVNAEYVYVVCGCIEDRWTDESIKRQFNKVVQQLNWRRHHRIQD
eukprot:GHVU01155353.1.p1 GENE.GHVU01155353.1~~GHVU01155353.1.p1  ORF type:complete len:147 (+),score=11.86 GHVU01155353.1:217-657(+)